MRCLNPKDVATYIYCPKLYQRNGQSEVVKPLTFFEAMMRDAFIDGERRAVLKDSIVDPRKFSRAWDNIWFPAAAKRGISMKVASNKTLHATVKFADYCKYDISDYTFPTAGVDIQSRQYIGQTELVAQADLLKIDMTTKNKTTVIVNFTKRDITYSQSAMDAAIRTTAYGFYSNRGEYVSCVNVNIDEKKEKLHIVTSNFSPKEMDDIRKMLYHVELGIRNNVFYHNSYMCKGCNKCPNSN